MNNQLATKVSSWTFYIHILFVIYSSLSLLFFLRKWKNPQARIKNLDYQYSSGKIIEIINSTLWDTSTFSFLFSWSCILYWHSNSFIDSFVMQINYYTFLLLYVMDKDPSCIWTCKWLIYFDLSRWKNIPWRFMNFQENWYIF